MRLGHLLIAMGVVGAAVNGCGGGAFQGAEGEENAGGEDSSSSGSKSTGGSKSGGSGGNVTTQPGAGGDDTGTGEGGAESGSGGSTTPLGGKSSGGQPPLGGNAGSATAGSGGSGGSGGANANAGTSGAGVAGNSSGVDGPLKIADLEAIDATKLTGFNATGFRCKSLTVCATTQGCIYYSGFIGSVQAQEASYSDGDELDNPQAVKLRIAQGAQSDPNACASGIFTTQPGQFVKLTHDGGHTTQVYFPEHSGTEVVLYVHANGNTYWDAALTQLAGKP